MSEGCEPCRRRQERLNEIRPGLGDTVRDLIAGAVRLYDRLAGQKGKVK